MKSIFTVMMAIHALSLFAEQWTDPTSGIVWTYTELSGGVTASLGINGVESLQWGKCAVSKETEGVLNVPEIINGLTVVSLSNNAFTNCEKLTAIILPDSINRIASASGERRELGAFYNCRSLQMVRLSPNLQSIASRSFVDCSSLTSLVIPDGVTSIGDYTFSGCSSLTEVVIPDSVTEIGKGAFSGCSSLTSVIIPDGVTSIGDSAFSSCRSLTEVTIPDSVTSIGDSAFSSCRSLTEVTIPDSVTSIGDSAFSGCSSLTSVIIPDGVTSIGDSAFSSCRSLTEVTIPDSVTSIGESAFYYCSSLTEVVIPESVTSIGGATFSVCSSLTSVVFKGDVPGGFSGSAWLTAFPKEYGAEWEQVLSESSRGTLVDVLVPALVTVEAWAEQPTTKTIKVTYTVRSELPSVKVRAVAWKDGVRSFANIVPVRTGEGVPRGERVSTNEEHTFVWDVASDWATDLDKVAVEILVQEGTLLPQELVTIPATKTHKAMTITRNALADQWLFDALVWCFAEEDARLTVSNGRVSVNGTDIAKDDKLPMGTSWDGSSNSGWNSEAKALLNYLYGKMGYKVLTGEDLAYVRSAMRLDFADRGLRQVSVKIEEGE